MNGVGIFWARSMPKGFDEFLNVLPWMRYPKWVDVEFLYYLTSSAPNSTLVGGDNTSLNFHGKLMWTNNFFGEAGFGIKRLHWVQYFSATDQKDFFFTSVYGTVGIGLSF